MSQTVCILFLLILSLIIIIFGIDFDYKKKLKKVLNKSDILLKKITEEMLTITNLDISANEKLEMLNKLLVLNLNSKYSTICLYDGDIYKVKASNIEKEYKEEIKDIAEDNTFKSNILKRNVKYLVAAKGKTLLYKSAIERNIKTAIFIPISFENNLLGFVLLEDRERNAFESIKDDVLIDLTKNISNFIENIGKQNVLETANILDTQTNFYNNVYLYTNARKILSENNTSAMIVVKLSNLPNINDIYNRNVGNILLVKLANATKEILGEEQVYIRYSGLRFIIFAKNSTAEIVHPKVERLLLKYQSIYEYVDDEKVSVNTQILLHTLRKQSNVEKEIQKTMSYLDWMKNTNTIKII